MNFPQADIPETVNVLLAAAIFISSIGLAYILKFFIERLGPRLVSRSRTTLDDEILKAIKGPIQLLVIALGAYVAAHMVSIIPEGAYAWLNSIMVIVAIFIAAYLLSNIAATIISWYEKRLDAGNGSRLDASLISFLKRLSSVVIYTIAILMAVGQFMEITPLLASVGVLSIAVALAAQELLSNVFGAFAILTDRPYKIGDRIELSGGEYGDVIDIGLKSTRIRTLDNKVIIIPNAEISKSRIYNYSEPDLKLRYTVRIAISYDSDVEKASSILLDIASGIDGVSKDPAPIVYVEGLGDFSINLVMLVWGNNFRKNWDIPDKIYRQALRRFTSEGIKIPYPVRSVLLDVKKSPIYDQS
ncbi:Small-conductance mechanosensitive channel [Methanocella conradii HZ254]|uniref:Small-conductance mechanosensitive channel n=1 Tax=Methanocella conradii (strain DSM 24694 / JCM 17849 / CGMCC 1.5162 / HZ254) TaxID=1041930 RepID=H8I4D0_METCZ|nr:mechanosensitive ion channel family protein [Methanocella conradii]AFC99687.1 Small-conductance mechanosensitive channel [Methanocella conradii HZ254]